MFLPFRTQPNPPKICKKYRPIPTQPNPWVNLTHGKLWNHTRTYTIFALRQCHRNLRILVYLLTGHNTLNRHFTIKRTVNDPSCPLCKEEEEEISLHFLSKCCTTANTRRLHFGVPFLEPGNLKQAHWITLLRFAKRF